MTIVSPEKLQVFRTVPTRLGAAALHIGPTASNCRHTFQESVVLDDKQAMGPKRNELPCFREKLISECYRQSHRIMVQELILHHGLVLRTLSPAAVHQRDHHEAAMMKHVL